MQTGKAQVTELILLDGLRHARIACPADLIPTPGQYLLVGDDSFAALPASLYFTDSAPDGFIAASAPESWTPGMTVHVRGPLGRGFNLPASARKVALVACDESPTRLRGLIQPALKQGAAIVLLTDSSAENLPDDVEVQPLAALGEIVAWADYAALDVRREGLPELVKRLGELSQAAPLKEAEVFIHTPAPCGGVSGCGVCAVVTKSGWKLACKDGPVFGLREIC
ncbi:MAG: hypothetical protein IT313_07830 [Anaerolineales bacterium]|nr:hypothetical protein [Anaerolineales bacterium]